MIDKEHISGIILAGGKSSRMGSDKGFLVLNDRLFIEHIINAMEPLVHNIILVSGNADYDVFGYKRVSDLIEDSGPLAGLYTGLYHSGTQYNMVLSCDVPLIKTFVLAQLINNADKPYDVVQLQSQGKSIPLIALYQKHCMSTCLGLLDKGEKRLRIAVEHFNTKTIPIAPEWEQYVKNINTIDQLKAVQNAVEH
jgi:molybdopterin-guanine dinucleotide biosynthesis protein A